MDTTKVKPGVLFKSVYVVENYGAFRDFFYTFGAAKAFVQKDGVYGKDCLYQIYKADIVIRNPKQKFFKYTPEE